MKGKLEEIISYARFANDISKYKVLYRDFDTLVECSLQEFLEQDDPPIPRHRIHLIRVKEGKKIRPVFVKHGYCPNCGQKLQDQGKTCYGCGFIVSHI
ncbi:MAG: hypothetical protein ACE5R6_12495 [Candidatus Heimdallarchaeota archaeon]